MQNAKCKSRATRPEAISGSIPFTTQPTQCKMQNAKAGQRALKQSLETSRSPPNPRNAKCKMQKPGNAP
jgi:hypothetical protein